MNLEPHVTPPTIRKIFEHYQAKRKNEYRRHLGGSQIGQDCNRACERADGGNDMVERYNIYPYDQYSTDERTSPTGDWVRYEDYQALQAERDAAVDRAKEVSIAAVAELQRQRNHLKAALEDAKSSFLAIAGSPQNTHLDWFEMVEWMCAEAKRAAARADIKEWNGE
jgi:hypothetical protein